MSGPAAITVMPPASRARIISLTNGPMRGARNTTEIARSIIRAPSGTISQLARWPVKNSTGPSVSRSRISAACEAASTSIRPMRRGSRQS